MYDLHWAWERKYSFWHRCWLSKSSDPSLSMFQTIFLPHQHGRSALDTSRTLFLLASTQGVSCRLVMNHLIYMYMFTLTPLIYMWVSVCTFMCIYLFSCPSVPAPQLLIFHREYLSWYINHYCYLYCCCVSIIIVICICPPGAQIWLINLFYSILYT